jgi:hypothetical protein
MPFCTLSSLSGMADTSSVPLVNVCLTNMSIFNIIGEITHYSQTPLNDLAFKSFEFERMKVVQETRHAH